jgi:hypothetical protein
MASAITIPVLPCISLDETVTFYGALGFEVTHQQTRPNVYLATRRGDVNLHFMGMKGLDPDAAYSTCLVIVPEVEQLHETFAAALRGLYGKVPVAGRPRISRMKKGQSRFTVVDAAGNSVVYIRRDAPDDYDEHERPAESDSRLGTALRTAARLRDFRNDDAMAAQVLDAALRRADAGTPIERARALTARAEVAAAHGDGDRVATCRAAIAELALGADERAAIDAELAAVAALLDGSPGRS